MGAGEPFYLQGWEKKNISIYRVGRKRTFLSTGLGEKEPFYLQCWEEKNLYIARLERGEHFYLQDLKKKKVSIFKV